MMFAGRPGRLDAGDVVAGSARASPGRARCARPRGGTARRRSRRRRSSNAATGAPAEAAVTVKPGRAPRSRSRRGSSRPAGRRAGSRSSTPASAAARSGVPPNSRSAGVRDRAAERLRPSPGSRSRCRTPARPASNSAGVDLRRARRVHAGRAAGQDDRGRVLGQHLGDRHVVRHDLGVDVGLADPARDQLGVLGAEVDDEHRGGAWLMRPSLVGRSAPASPVVTACAADRRAANKCHPPGDNRRRGGNWKRPQDPRRHRVVDRQDAARLRVVPGDCRTPEKRLGYYASQFPIVEVDATYYPPPAEETAGVWAGRTPEGFTFNIKAFSLLTGHPTKPSALYKDLRPETDKKNIYPDDLPPQVYEDVWTRFLSALDPLVEAGKLGVLLFQFPPWFTIRKSNKQYLLEVAKRCAPLRVGGRVPPRVLVRRRQPGRDAGVPAQARAAVRVRGHAAGAQVVDSAGGGGDGGPGGGAIPRAQRQVDEQGHPREVRLRLFRPRAGGWAPKLRELADETERDPRADEQLPR